MKFLYYTFRYFLVTFHQHYFRLLYRLVIIISHKFGVVVMLRSFFKPLFGFPGILSRINGIFTRTLVLLTALLFLGMLLILGLGLYVFLVISPVYITYKFGVWGIVFVGLIILIKWYQYHIKPIREIRNYADIEEYFLSGGLNLRNAMNYAKSSDYSLLLDNLKKNKFVDKFIKRLEINKTELFDYLDLNSDKYSWNEFKDKMVEVNLVLKYSHVKAEVITSVLLLNFNKHNDFLAKNNLKEKDLLEALVFNKELYEREMFIWENEYKLPPSGGSDKGWAISYTGVLNKCSNDLTARALKGFMPKRIGREEVLDQSVAVLSKSSRNNLLLLGESGAGKTTFVKAIARDIAMGTSIPALRYKRVVELDIGSLTSGAKGDIQERMTSIIKEIEVSGNIILFIDEIHNLSSTQSSDPNAAPILSILEPHLNEGDFQLIGTTSRANYSKYLEPNSSFAGAFDIVELRETNREETIRVIADVVKHQERSDGAILSYKAVSRAYDLGKRYIHDRAFPDKAVELVIQTFAALEKSADGLISRDDISDVLSETLNIPVAGIDDNERDKLLNLERDLHSRIIGQYDAVTQVANAIKRSRAGIRDESKPIASFLFAGPTGVGKTETARALTDLYFGSDKNIVRIDMSEYNNPESINRLIGNKSDPGYLTAKVRAKPYTLLLLDEIEKADYAVTNLFLQVLDEGRLTDGMGNTIDFTNTIIIATTNIGTQDIRADLESGNLPDRSYLSEKILSALKSHFTPEFLNRFTALIPFQPLSEDEIMEVTRLKLKKVEKTLADQNIQLKYSDLFIQQIAKKGYSIEWGARPLGRVIEEVVETKIADILIRGDVKSGGTIDLDLFDINNI